MTKTDPSYVCWLLLPCAPWVFLKANMGFQKIKTSFSRVYAFHIPRCSMYGMLAYIHHKVQPNVGKYTIFMDPIYGIGDDAFDYIHNVTPFGIPVFQPISNIHFTFSEGFYETRGLCVWEVRGDTPSFFDNLIGCLRGWDVVQLYM